MNWGQIPQVKIETAVTQAKHYCQTNTEAINDYLLLISCLLEISVELGLHEFEDFASHHGLAIFAFGSLFANWDDLTGALKELKKVKND